MKNLNEFVKFHALGNDYIVLDANRLNFSLNKNAIRRICDRHYGIGSDGILLLVPSKKADFGLRIYNPDGTEAEKSGNGLRIFAKFLYDYNYTKKTNFSIETKGGLVNAHLEISKDKKKEHKVHYVIVDMGSVSFMSSDVPVKGKNREVVDEELLVDGKSLCFTALSIGNPHCVIFTQWLNPEEIKTLGPKIEHHILFPKHINVQMAQVISKKKVKILIWERGAGYTLSSGSSSCAVAAACVKKGLTERDLTISMPGGELKVEVAQDWSIRLAGPVEEICRGRLTR